MQDQLTVFHALSDHLLQKRGVTCARCARCQAPSWRHPANFFGKHDPSLCTRPKCGSRLARATLHTWHESEVKRAAQSGFFMAEDGKKPCVVVSQSNKKGKRRNTDCVSEILVHGRDDPHWHWVVANLVNASSFPRDLRIERQTI